ncbi:MAG TPA: hypothetical protein GX513_08440 [Firmicutes bacterium]|nr:hypothetical protein [Bacillota bacterium]
MGERMGKGVRIRYDLMAPVYDWLFCRHMELPPQEHGLPAKPRQSEAAKHPWRELLCR